MTTLRTAATAAHVSVFSVVIALACVAGTITGASPAVSLEPLPPAAYGNAVSQAVSQYVRLTEASAVAADLTPELTGDLTSDLTSDLTADLTGSPIAGLAQAQPAHVFTGQAFDTCSAPGLDTLRSWHGTSPYGALGVYVGGSNRGCSQPQLSRDWARSASALGWNLLPLYVGSQAPCLMGDHTSSRIDPRHALAEGDGEGHDAVRALHGLGLAAGSPVYLDMESYARDGDRCTLAVLQYTAGWSAAVRSAGYLAGFYSSADSGIADLAAAAFQRRSAIGLPDVVWYARWDRRASTDGYRALSQRQWVGHRRVHQFSGNTTESHGGVTMTVDRNAVDAPVGIIG